MVYIFILELFFVIIMAVFIFLIVGCEKFLVWLKCSLGVIFIILLSCCILFLFRFFDLIVVIDIGIFIDFLVCFCVVMVIFLIMLWLIDLVWESGLLINSFIKGSCIVIIESEMLDRMIWGGFFIEVVCDLIIIR